MTANANSSKSERVKMKKEESSTSKTADPLEHMDPVLKQKIQQVMDMTQCTQDNALFALHDSDNDVNMAVNMLLESGNNMQGEWQEQKGKNKKKQISTHTKDEEAEPAVVKDSTADNSDNIKENRQYHRNAPPRFQRGGSSRRQDFKSRDNDNSENSEGPGRRFGEGPGRRFGGERGRGRNRGGRGRGGPRHMGGDRNRGMRSNDNGDQQDSGTAIGTWTNEVDADPKTDSWGEVWGDEDNQWTGDLKGTHVFESSAKSVDTFPTPTEFDPSAVTAQPTTNPPLTNLNGNSQANLDVDTSFPKPQVETLKPSTSIYDNQLASESIKNAIGINSQTSGHPDKKLPSSNPVSSQGLVLSSSSSSTLVQTKNVKQLRSKLPPPSTKIPTAPVEMPHNAAAMVKLGVQFGAMDFSADTFESSSLGSSFNVTPSSSSDRLAGTSSSILQSSNSLYNSSSAQSGPDPMSYPGSTGQSGHNSTVSPAQPVSNQAQAIITSISSSDIYNSSISQHGNNMYSSSSSTSHYKTSPTSSASSQPQTQQSASSSITSSQQQPFHSNNRSSLNSGNYYQVNQTDRGKSSGYQSSPTQSSNNNSGMPSSSSSQYASSLYMSSEPHYNQYGIQQSSGLTQPSSLGSSQSSQPHTAQSNSSSRLSGGQQSSTKPPPNLPPPIMGIPNYMMAPGIPYYNQPIYNMDEIQKMPPFGYYDVSQPYNMTSGSVGSYSGTGSGDGKVTRVDAQSPTVQGAQSQNQSQQQSSSTASVQAAHQQQQQFMSIPPGYHAGYYYHGGMVGPYSILQMPSVTQNMTLPGSTTTAGYQSQKTGSSASLGSSYYNAGSSYEDMTHGSHNSDFTKSVYTGNKQPNSASATNSELSSIYKGNSQAGNNAVYGSSPSAYMNTGHSGHMIPQQPHIIQSPETRSSQSGGLGPKQNSKQSYYNNWSN